MIRPENQLRQTRDSAARTLVIGVVLIALVAAGITYLLLSRPAPKPQPNLARNDSPTNKLLTTLPANPSATNLELPKPATNLALKPPVTDLPAGQLVTNLAAIDLGHGPFLVEQATAWKATLGLLLAKGQDAIPAIRDFLDRKQDLYFDMPGAADALGTPTLRLALLGALEEIGGPEAIATAQRTLQATADPTELVALTRFLDRAEPGTHRAEFARAAKETLALAASGNWDDRDVAPLFEMLRTFGGAAELAELERHANMWFNYTPITLVHWPDDAGVPLLIKLAQNADGSITLGQDVYQRMLAERAVNSPTAADAIVELVRGGKIDVNAWPAIGKALAGDTLHFAKSYLSPPLPLLSRPGTRSYHLVYGNQNFVEASLPDETPATALADRIRLVDRLLEATTQPPATQTLVSVRAALSARLPTGK